MNANRMESEPTVVVAGAGFAGLGAAHILRRRLGDGARITVVSPSAHFYFAPSLVWSPFGRESQPSIFDIEPALRAHDIAFVRSPVHEVRVGEQQVVVDDGVLPYDRLLVATGGQPDAHALPGLAGQFRHAAWIVGEESAMDVRDVMRRLVDNPGPLVVGAAQGASYISAAYELALLSDLYLRDEGVRERVPITFLTAEPALGDLGFGQSAAGAVIGELFAERQIEARVGVRIAEVGGHAVTLEGGDRIPAAAAIIMPPMTGVADIWKSAGLTDQTGLIPVNEHYGHPRLPSVYAAGIAAYFQQPVPPLGGYRAPHTGYLSLCMGATAAASIAASLGRGDAPTRTLPRLVDVRVLDGGSDGVFLASHGDLEPHHEARRMKWMEARHLKESIERYLLSRLQTGLVGGFVAGSSQEAIPVPEISIVG